MRSSQRTAWVYGLLAAALWSPHFYVVESLRNGGVPVLAIAFHLLLWPAAACLALLFLTGRASELTVFNRRETQFLILAGVGGYGFWVLRALGLEMVGGPTVRGLFCAAPLLMGVLSLAGREKADGKAFWGLLLGLAGALALVRGGSPAGMWAGPFHAKLLALGAAVCWAVFSLMARPLVREERALPVVALVTGIGAVCVGVTCLSRGDNPFHLNPVQLRTVGVAGLLTAGLMMGAWLKCLAGTPVAQAALLWYLAPLFGLVAAWRYRHPVDFGWTLAGAVFVVLALRVASRRPARAGLTMGDVIRSG
jgi:drug/metabolite transporter (DMT)-like permease